MGEPAPDLDEAYLEFVDRFAESGCREIPADWPELLRDRCRFFLEVMELSRQAQEEGGEWVLPEGDPGMATPSLSDDLPAGAGVPAFTSPQGGERYSIEGELAHGGMGRILIAYDRSLRRRIAMKVMLHPETGASFRFLAEAQATAQLEHPNICPVYDLGIEAGGRTFFTMKLVHGRSLNDVIRTEDFSLTRLIQILQQVAMGIDFAHSHGVIHRDLKPSNVMIGDYGEVLVMDWGLAKIARKPAEKSPAGAKAQAPVSTARCDEGAVTLDGSVQGSVAYMAPEQARGETREIDERTDVFGLGAILYQVLCGLAPHPDEDPRAALARARRGEIPPPRARAPHRDIPSLLEAICLKALSPRKEDRHRSAREFHDELQRYIEGIHDAERRAAQARELGEIAGRHLSELRRALERGAELEKRHRDLLGAAHDYDTEEAKEGLWSLEEELGENRHRADSAFQESTAAYQSILNIDPANKPAREALADLYLERLEAAEARADREAAGIYAALVAQHATEKHAARLRGEGLISIDTRPSGAEVCLYRYRERGRRLVKEGRELIGKTPLELPLPMGSYLLELRRDGCREASYPVFMERCGSHEGVVHLYREAIIPAGFVYVPEGAAWVGGESDAFRPLPRARVPVGDLFVGEFPVTFAQYCEFLNDPEMDRGESWREFLPFFGREQYTEENARGEHVPKFDPQWPIFGIPAAATLAYCVWYGRKIRQSGLRLLREVEWEKCARGADGRLYPWGNRFDWSFAKGGRSRKEPYPEPVGKFPQDCSPYGIRDLAGCVREFTGDWFAENYRALRGGSWFNGFEITFRADMRTYCLEGNRVSDVGFRVAFEGSSLREGASP